MRVRFYPITDGDDSHNVTRCAEKILFSGFNGIPDLSVMFKTESRTLLCFFPGVLAMIKLLCMTWGCSMAVKRGFSPCDSSLDSGFVHLYWCLAWNLVRCLKPGPSLSWDSDLKSNFEITAQLFNWVLMCVFDWLSHVYSNPDTTILPWSQYQVGHPLCLSLMCFNNTNLFLIKYNKVQSS